MNNKRKFVSLYHPFLLSLFEGDEQRALALFFKAKKAYKNSCYYDWTYKSLSEKLRLSVYIVKKYIPILIDKGFAYEHNGNLIFKSTFKIINDNEDCVYKKGWHELNIKFNDSLGTILNEIYLVSIKQELSHQQYHIQKKTDCNLAQKENAYISKNKKRQIKDYVNEYGLPGEVSQDTVLGLRKIANICNISLGKANKIIKELESKGKIKTKVISTVLKKDVSEKYLDVLRDAYKNEIGHFFVKNGILMSIIGTSIILL